MIAHKLSREEWEVANSEQDDTCPICGEPGAMRLRPGHGFESCDCIKCGATLGNCSEGMLICVKCDHTSWLETDNEGSPETNRECRGQGMKKLIPILFLAGCLEVVYHPPQPSPTPTETPTPVEAQSPAPFETPSPAPTAPPDLCDLPPSTGPAETCILNPKTKPSFLEDIHEAQRLAENNGFVVGGIVTHELAYTAEIARILRNMGLCAISDKDEVLVKTSNEESQHYDLVTSWQEPWDGYVALCKPSKF